MSSSLNDLLHLITLCSVLLCCCEVMRCEVKNNRTKTPKKKCQK